MWFLRYASDRHTEADRHTDTLIAILCPPAGSEVFITVVYYCLVCVH